MTGKATKVANALRSGAPTTAVVAGVGWLIVATGWVSLNHLATVAESVGAKGVSIWLIAGTPDALGVIGGVFALRATSRLEKALAWGVLAMGITLSLGGNVAAVLGATDAEGWLLVQAIAVAAMSPVALAAVALLVKVSSRSLVAAPAVAPVPASKVRKVAPVSSSPAPLAVPSPKAAPAGVATALPTATAEQGSGAAEASTSSTSRGRTTPVPAEEVRRLAAEYPGWTQAEVAEHLGCSVRTVRRHLADPGDEAQADDVPVVPAVDEIDQFLHELTPAAMNGAHR